MKPLYTIVERALLSFILAVAINASSGQTFEPGWPAPNNAVHAVAHDPVTHTVFIGGVFTTVGGQVRNRIASYNSLTGTLNTWAPSIDGAVYALEISGGILYVGGDFEEIDGTTRNNLAAFTIATGQLVTTWNPNVNNRVQGIDLYGTTLYIGGDFSSVQGVTRYTIAGVNTTGSGSATAFNAGFNLEPVRSVSVGAGVVYAGGWFENFGGAQRDYLAAMAGATGMMLPWDPSPDDRVKSVLYDAGLVYVAGSFGSVGGAFWDGVAAIDATTGLATSWNAGLNDDGLAIARAGNLVYVGGAFTSAGGQPRNALAAINATTGVATNWNPGLASGPNTIYVYTITIGDGRIFVGGEFQTVGGVSHPYFAVWSGAPVGIDEVDGSIAELTVSPNPTSGMVQLGLVNPEAQNVIVHDMLGQQVGTLDFEPTVDLGWLPPGMYSVTVLDRKGNAMARARVMRD